MHRLGDTRDGDLVEICPALPATMTVEAAACCWASVSYALIRSEDTGHQYSTVQYSTVPVHRVISCQAREPVFKYLKWVVSE